MLSRERFIDIVSFVVFLILFASGLIVWFGKGSTDFVYYGHTALPAPCPLPKKGYWPRDCP
jgi:hypothetical protein